MWYTGLTRLERGIVDLTIRFVDTVRSKRLGVVIVKILAKLKEALKNRFVKHMESYGWEEARKVAAQAVSLGYFQAKSWVNDFGFIRFLTFMDLNRPSGWGL